MNADEDNTDPNSPEEGEREPPTTSSTSSIGETIVMIIIGIAVIFGVLVLLVLGTCFLG